MRIDPTASIQDVEPMSLDDSANLEPDTARSYERAKPLKECGQEGLEKQPVRRCCSPDQMHRAAHNAHEARQLNNESGCDAGASNPL